MLADYYLRPYQAAIKHGGARGIMCSYNVRSVGVCFSSTKLKCMGSVCGGGGGGMMVVDPSIVSVFLRSFPFFSFPLVPPAPLVHLTIPSARPSGMQAVLGIPTCLSPLMRNARAQWGFDGYVTSDSDSVQNAYANHQYPQPDPTAQKVSKQAYVRACVGGARG